LEETKEDFWFPIRRLWALAHSVCSAHRPTRIRSYYCRT